LADGGHFSHGTPLDTALFPGCDVIMTNEKEPTQYPASIDPEPTLPTTPSADPKNRCGSLSASRAATLFLAIFSVILLTDLWSKTAAFEYLGSEVHYNSDGLPYLLQTPIREIFPGFGLEASLNLGAFNGWFSGMTILLISISALSVPVCFVVALRMKPRACWMVASLALIGSGAAGNLYDRSVIGGVRDFIRWSIPETEYVWPNFNIADSAIVCGVAIILIRELILMKSAARTSSG
jgi:lipoprotein signal peptidase